MNDINSYIMNQLCSWNVDTFTRQMENISLPALTDNWSCNKILDQTNVIKQKLIATNLWRQQDAAQDFQALLASKHGSKLIHSLTNNFVAKTSPSSQKDHNPTTNNWKFPPWQLILQPSNLNTPIPHARKDYWFCTKCNPPCLVRHKDSEHKTGFKQTSKKLSSMTGDYSMNLASACCQLSSLITAQKKLLQKKHMIMIPNSLQHGTCHIIPAWMTPYLRFPNWNPLKL